MEHKFIFREEGAKRKNFTSNFISLPDMFYKVIYSVDTCIVHLGTFLFKGIIIFPAGAFLKSFFPFSSSFVSSLSYTWRSFSCNTRRAMVLQILSEWESISCSFEIEDIFRLKLFDQQFILQGCTGPEKSQENL